MPHCSAALFGLRGPELRSEPFSPTFLVRFLVFDTAWVYGDFDDAPFNRRLVGLSDQAAFGSGDQNDLGYDGLVHPDIVGNT